MIAFSFTDLSTWPCLPEPWNWVCFFPLEVFFLAHLIYFSAFKRWYIARLLNCLEARRRRARMSLPCLLHTNRSLNCGRTLRPDENQKSYDHEKA